MRIGAIARKTAGALALTLFAAACVGSGSATTTAPTTSRPTATAASPVTTAPPTTVASTVPSGASGAAYRWEVGDCLAFSSIAGLDRLPYAPYGDDSVVGCGEPHTHEVYLATQLAEGVDDAFPGDELSTRVEQTCIEGFSSRVGISHRDSWYDLVFYLPDAEEWAAGERYLACVLYQTGPSGTIVELRGSVVGDPEEATWPVAAGDCLGGRSPEPSYGGPVPCSGRHTHEVVADLVHPAGPGAPYPGGAEVDAYAATVCEEEYVASGGDPAEPGVVVGARFVGRVDWEMGYRRLVCVAIVVSESGELLEGRGSLLDRTWEAAGVYREDELVTA